MSPFTRNFQDLDSVTYDLFVIGGGIVGLSVAEDAARRGMRVILCEANDFSAETSAGCFRLIHGGMRYLQHLDFSRMFDSVKEQNILRKRAPHLIRPVPFILPCYGQGKEGRWFLELGMTLYEMLTPSRSRLEGAWGRLRKHDFLPAAELLARFPGLPSERLTGGVRMWDCQMSSPDRLSLAVARSAAESGATVLNYVRVEKVQRGSEEQSPWSLMLKDVLSGAKKQVLAKSIVNATGPWAAEFIRTSFGEAPLSHASQLTRPLRSKGFQLVLPPIVEKEALAISSRQVDPTSTFRRGKRSYFLVPWQGYTLAGTTDETFQGDPESFQVTRADVQRFLEELRVAYRSPLLRIEQVLQTFGGILPTEDLQEGQRILKDDIIIDHAQSDLPLPRFLSVVAVKYTTFRALAEKVVDRLVEKIGGVYEPSQTMHSTLFGGDVGDKEILTTRLMKEYRIPSENTLENLLGLYGSEASTILSRVRGEVSEDSLLTAQTEHAIEQEMALSLADIVFRRTSLGSGGRPSSPSLEKMANICQEKLGWSDAHRSAEIRKVFMDRRFSFLEESKE